MIHWPSSARYTERKTSVTGSSGTWVDNGRHAPFATKMLLADARRRVDQPGLPDPRLAGDQQQTAAGLEVTPDRGQLAAAAGDPSPGAEAGPLAASHNRRNSPTSPPIASTTSSNTPHDGSLGEENTVATVVCEQPASRASDRRLGQPASWCSAWSASTRSRWAPGGTSGRASPPTQHLPRARRPLESSILPLASSVRHRKAALRRPDGGGPTSHQGAGP